MCVEGNHTLEREQRKKPAKAFRLRLREDLEFYPQRYRKQRIWVIKDPLSMRYFQFKEEEYAVMRQFDGQSDLETIKHEFERRHRPQTITMNRLHAFGVSLHRNGLVIANHPKQSDEMLLRNARNKKQLWFSLLMNPLALRLPGLNPKTLLNWLYPKTSWFISTTSILACLLLSFAALVLVCFNFSDLVQRLPNMNVFLSAENLIWLSVALALTKVLHELGHALACKHFGCECNEIGLMLLVFTPCLYCNVSDAWKLQNHWQRVAITAAGIYVELVLASFCTFLWYFTQPGFINSISLNVMIVCSVGTIFLNGNPLMRYDGYYILSDLLESPNLWQNACQQLNRFYTRIFFGYDPGNPLTLQEPSPFLFAYAVTSRTYRLVVVISIIYFVYRVLTPLGLSLAATIITALIVASMLVSPLKIGWKHMTDRRTRQQIRPQTTAISLTAFALITVFFLFVPLPCKITTPLTIEPRNPDHIYVKIPGRLLETVQNGDYIECGNTIARLENLDLRREFDKMEASLTVQRIRVRSLEVLRSQAPDLANDLPAATAVLEDLAQQREQLREQLNSLTLIAPKSGWLLAPPSKSKKQTNEAALEQWSGTPLDHANLGSKLETQTLVCSIVQPNDFKAVLSVDQADIQYIRLNQVVQLHVDMNRGHILTGKITAISGKGTFNKLADAPKNTKYDRSATCYQVDVALETNDGNTMLLADASGTARIKVARQALGLKLFRFLTKIFRPIV
ncbi:MAG: hypothetical protein CL917_04180 [Deltaproteobacteria bacterium]|nr:hypothetical protein [Deltaproteobacteria bacterium]